MIQLHDLAAPSPPPVAEVGGKAHALALMAGHGLPVPGGFVLPVDFFTPQLRALEALQGERYLRLAERRPANEAFLYGWLANRVGER